MINPKIRLIYYLMFKSTMPSDLEAFDVYSDYLFEKNILANLTGAEVKQAKKEKREIFKTGTHISFNPIVKAILKELKEGKEMERNLLRKQI